MSKKKQIGYSLIVWETLKEYNEETKWYEPTKNKRVEVAQLLSEELSDNEEVKSMLLDRLFGYKDNIKEMLKNNEFTEIPDYHKESLEKDQKIADLEAKLADMEQEQIKEMQEHQEAMQVANNTIKDLEANLELHKQSNMVLNDQLNKATEHLGELEDKLAEKDEQIERRVAVYEKNFIEQTDEIFKLNQQLADTEEQNKRVLEKLELIVRANQELEQKLAEKEKEIEDIRNTHIYRFYLNEDKVQDVYMTDVMLKVFNQDKISFALERLEKVKEFVKENESWEIEGSDYPIVYVDDVLEKIDNQIKQLKEMK